MASILLICVLILLGTYIQKMLLHYKLLRIEAEGDINEDEDYAITWLTSNKHFLLKIQSCQLHPITGSYDDPLRNSLKKKINKLLKHLSWMAIVTLVLTLINVTVY